jgi:hypothetical protein
VVTATIDGRDARCCEVLAKVDPQWTVARNAVLTAESPSPAIHVPTRKRLAVSWLHRPRSGRRPVNIRVRCKTVGAAILRLKKLDVNSIRYLVAAAALPTPQHSDVRGTHSDSRTDGGCCGSHNQDTVDRSETTCSIVVEPHPVSMPFAATS